MKTLDSLAAGKDVPGDVDDDKEWGQKSPPPWFDQARFDRYTLHKNAEFIENQANKHMTSTLNLTKRLNSSSLFNLHNQLQTASQSLIQ